MCIHKYLVAGHTPTKLCEGLCQHWYSEYVETRMYEGQFLLLIVHSKMLVSCPAHVGLLVRNGLVNKVEFLAQKW